MNLMASKNLLRDLVTSFSTLSLKKMGKDEVEELVDIYSRAFEKYSDKQIREAGYQYMDIGDHFPPTPNQLASCISTREKDRHTKELIERYTCPSCGHIVTAMTEGQCLDCAGIPPKTTKEEPIEIEKQDYRMEGRRKCQVCGKVEMCIKEPRLTGSWKCVDCYTGLTKKQRTNRFKDLLRMVEDKSFVPEWAKELVEKYPKDMPLTIKRINRELPEQDDIPF
jgi:hypothetical protein